MSNLTINLDDLPDEIKAKLTAWVNKPKECPQEGERYWFVAVDSEINNTIYASGSIFDLWRKESGNCFRTEAEAIAYREHLKVCAELRRLADWDGHGVFTESVYPLLA